MKAATFRKSLVVLGWIAATTPSCGPQIIIPPRNDENSGGGGAAGASSSSSSSSGVGGSSACVLDDVSTWEIENYNAGGDHPRFAPATSGSSWVAFAVANGNVVFENLAVDDQGIVVAEKFELPDSPVYPLAFDANEQRFVLLSTTGHNWNGSLEIWLVDRASGSILRQPVGNPDDPSYTIRAALGLMNDSVVVGYARPATNEGVIEIRNGNLEVMTSRLVDNSDFRGVWRRDSAFDIYIGKNRVANIDAGDIVIADMPTRDIIGGLGPYLVDIGTEIRLSNENETWAGPWPHTQISAPAVVRMNAERAVFALETELSGVVGYPKNGALDWLRVEPLPGAWGAGVVVLPVFEERRLGMFYVGLEIPHPEQPLRYFGRICRQSP